MTTIEFLNAHWADIHAMAPFVGLLLILWLLQ